MPLHLDAAVLAYQAADTTRLLHRAVAEPAGLADMDAVRAVAEGMQLTVQQLPGVLREVSAGLRVLEEQAIDAGTVAAPSEAVAKALRALLNASQALAVAGVELRMAEGSLARVGVASEVAVAAE